MGKPLNNYTIAVTGDFGERRDTQKMKIWIQVNGGTFASEMSSKVTHLVCSKEHFKKNISIVRLARTLKTVKIVSFDWLEDSLMKQSPKNVREYLMAPMSKAKAETKAKKKATRKKNIAKGMEAFERSCKEFEKDMHASTPPFSLAYSTSALTLPVSENYSIYHDTTNFAYDITLARANLLTNKNSRYSLKVCSSSPTTTSPSTLSNTRTTPSPLITTPLFPILPTSPAPRARLHTPRAQRLQLYVSHATPKLFATYVKYSAPGEEAKIEQLAPVGSLWETAWEAFVMFFRLKTRKEWEGRGVRGWLGDAFVYTPPRVGEPRGVGLEEGG